MLFLWNCPVCNWIMHALDLSLIWYIILSIYTFLILVKDNQDYLLFIVLPLLVNKDDY